MATIDATQTMLSVDMIRERMTDYAAVLNDVVTVLYAPRQRLSSADRRAITRLLDAMTDVNTMVLYHFNCRRLPTENLVELHSKVARLAPQIRRA
ncbi:MAG: hypothetical protein H6949_04755 [Zoogloeaceae bacterium]|nr:hypothetical protein [Zoogloeaceae bacterium]